MTPVTSVTPRRRKPRNPFEARSRVTDIIPDVRRVLADSSTPLTAAQIAVLIHGPDYEAWQWWDITGALERLRCPREYSREHRCCLYRLPLLAPKIVGG